MYKLIYLFMIFLIYSVIGYLCEITAVSRANKRLVLSRGYLIGPVLPVFGFGGLIITIFLQRYADNPLTLFILGMVDCCALEYLTSYIMEKIYSLRWWDYSDKRFNINGRICLETGVLFGIGSLIIINITNPIIFYLLNKIPEMVLIIIGIIAFILLIIDFIISTNIIVKLKIDTKKYFKKDATKEIREQVFASIKKHSHLYSRILKAFPQMKKEDSRINHLMEALKKAKEMRKSPDEKE